ncbi:MAG TPA: hypothetical protein VK797_22620 [Tepidisphaeraceae bacterium]|jgi:hypothetical protein|nr:hypothetical protein [Tepidisphaeraceae bacterium]
MDQRYQEFYCRQAGGGCGGYILLPVTNAGTYKLKFICPKCKHVHDRAVFNGEIVNRTVADSHTIELLPTLSAWSPEPRTRSMRAMHLRRLRAHKRDWLQQGATLASKPRHFLDESWFNTQGVQA